MSKNAIYYDLFANVYCNEEDRETIAPPERYLRTVRGTDFYTEKWNVVTENGRVGFLDVSYSEQSRTMHEENSIRYRMEIANKCRLTTMRYWYIPSEKFDEYVKRFGLDVEETEK